ncbi:hypothetical protein HDU76_001333 [Blyttiomyces sp. JEL0837]|nr:hypothetical protein HDU76_001333 [Blyttiomyces sp. JEL0837]
MTVAKPPPTKKKYLQGIDNAFLSLEDEHHLMTVSSIYTFINPMDPAEIRQQVNQFAMHTECCKRIVAGYSKGIFDRPYWVDIENFDIDQHFRIVTLPSPGSHDQLLQALSEQVSAKFDFTKPLWDTVFFQGLDNGKSVLFLKAHHCIADGQGFVRNLLSYVASVDSNVDKASLQYSAGRHTPVPSTAATTTSPKSVEASVADLKQREQSPVSASATNKLSKPPRKPSSKPNPVMLFINLIISLILYLTNITNYLFSQRKSFTRQKLTSKKQVGFSSSVSLDDVKKVKNMVGLTVNDVLLTALSGAIERFLRERDALKDSDKFWFFVPTSLRRPDDWSVSNRTSGYVLKVPITNGNHKTSMTQIHQRMLTKKQNPEPTLHFVGGNIFYRYPNLIPTFFKTFGAQNIHAVVTNVPGPSEKLPWGSQKINEIISFIPQASPNSLGCTIYTYDGIVSVSVMMDLDNHDSVFAWGGAQRICDLFEEVFREVGEEVEEEVRRKVESEIGVKRKAL